MWWVSVRATVTEQKLLLPLRENLSLPNPPSFLLWVLLEDSAWQAMEAEVRVPTPFFFFVCLRPLYSQCVGPLTPHTEHKTGSTHRTVCDVHPEFELWMSTVCLHLLQMIIIIIFRCNIESLIWAQNYASVVVGDYFSAGTLVHVGRSRLLMNNQKCCKKTQWASPSFIM